MGLSHQMHRGAVKYIKIWISSNYSNSCRMMSLYNYLQATPIRELKANLMMLIIDTITLTNIYNKAKVHKDKTSNANRSTIHANIRDNK